VTVDVNNTFRWQSKWKDKVLCSQLGECFSVLPFRRNTCFHTFAWRSARGLWKRCEV